jgi:glycerol kinase
MTGCDICVPHVPIVGETSSLLTDFGAHAHQEVAGTFDRPAATFSEHWKASGRSSSRRSAATMSVDQEAPWPTVRGTPPEKMESDASGGLSGRVLGTFVLITVPCGVVATTLAALPEAGRAEAAFIGGGDWLIICRARSSETTSETVAPRTRRNDMPSYVAAIDQGTTSTRFMIFDAGGKPVGGAQKEHEQVYPQPGWVEHNPEEIWTRTREVIAEALESTGVAASDLAAVGVTNQRETAVVWDRATGEPVYNAIVWQDIRTDQICRELAADGGSDRFRASTGLPLATYFAGPKVAWILDNVAGARARAASGDLLFGTIDTWIIWNLTGGINGGLHITDVSNASRTLLMDLGTLQWSRANVDAIGIPPWMLPEIKASSAIYGEARLPELAGVPVAGDLGDQQAALFGQTCFDVGDAKNTYGTGNFLLLNTGTKPVVSTHGLLTSVGYRIGDQPTVYVLEGSIAIAGALVQWLRDNLRLIDSASEIEELARTVDDNGGAYFVPAFSGLFAPHWRDDARGVIVGLTRFVDRGHIARAALEATAFQGRELVEAMEADSGVALNELKVDGGMVKNELLMQFQADILNVPVIRPSLIETTVLGAAYAAGLAVGFWPTIDVLRAKWSEDKRWLPQMDEATREREFAQWNKAVTRTLDWVDVD